MNCLHFTVMKIVITDDENILIVAQIFSNIFFWYSSHDARNDQFFAQAEI